MIAEIMVGHAALLVEHARIAPSLQRRGDAMCTSVAAWLADAGIKVHSVTARVKDPASLARKLARPDRSYVELWDVTDLLGLRVITYFEDDVDRIGRIVEGRLPIDLARSIDKRRRGEPVRFGYRSLHYVFELGDPETFPERARAEIQIRTLLEHTWAEIEHDLGYKAPGAVPESVRRRLSRVAGLLEIADLEFVAIRDELAAYERALPARIASHTEDVELDERALHALVRSPDVDVIDRAIGAALDRPLGDRVFFPDYLLRLVQLAGLSTIAELRAAIEQHGRRIPALATPYFQFAWSTWRLSPTTGDDSGILRGYAVFFVAHAHVLAGAGLELDKVERLTRLYHQLDYPDDMETAQRIASQLVAVLRSTLLADVA